MPPPTYKKQLPGETKGLGKGGEGRKGTGRKGLLAIMDKECADEEKPTEEEEWKNLLGKAKIAKDHMAAAKADLLDAIEEAEKSKRLTEASKKTQRQFAKRWQGRRKW